MMRILLVEDDRELCRGMVHHLKNNGYEVDFCHEGNKALFYAEQESYNIIILDRMLPEMDGLAILKGIRKKRISMPVIMVTAMDAVDDRIDGLDSGADDYLVKPFVMDELLARIRALTRRSWDIKKEDLLTFENMTLDTSNQVLCSDTESCALSKKENELLEFFMKNPCHNLPRERILYHVWGADTLVEDGNLDNYIYFLRKRLKSIGGHARIRNIHSVGYRLEGLPEDEKYAE